MQVSILRDWALMPHGVTVFFIFSIVHFSFNLLQRYEEKFTPAIVVPSVERVCPECCEFGDIQVHP